MRERRGNVLVARLNRPELWNERQPWRRGDRISVDTAGAPDSSAEAGRAILPADYESESESEKGSRFGGLVELLGF